MAIQMEKGTHREGQAVTVTTWALPAHTSWPCLFHPPCQPGAQGPPLGEPGHAVLAVPSALPGF